MVGHFTEIEIDHQEKGLDALDEVLDQIMTEEAFYIRLKEGFNDIFLTDGYETGTYPLL